MSDDLQQAARVFTAIHPEVEAVFLFGSQAIGRARIDSDIDLAFLLERSISRKECFDFTVATTAWFCEQMCTDAVEIVVLNIAGIVLRMEVVRHGIVLWARDTDRVVRYQSATVSEYEDTEIFRRRNRQALIRRIKEGDFGVRSTSDPTIVAEAARVYRTVAQRRAPNA